MDIALNNDGDLDLSTGDLFFVDGADEAAQRVRIKLRFFKGEWWIDPSFGMPWFRDVLKKNPQIDVVRNTILKGIESEPGIDKVTELVVQYDAPARTLFVESVRLIADGEFMDFQGFDVIEL